MTKPKSRRVIAVLAVLAIFAAYLAGPVIASVFEVGDRRGPVIYPQWLHESVYVIVWDCTSHESNKPRVSRNSPPRPWFYGL